MQPSSVASLIQLRGKV